MAAPAAPRRRFRFLPDLLSTLLVYGFVAFGTYLFARQTLGAAPGFPNMEESLPIAVLGIVPLSLAVIFILRIRAMVIDIRLKRYGAQLRLRLVGLFLLVAAAASLPQGVFLLRLALRAQSAGAQVEVREALNAGQTLALAWYDEEIAKLERIAADLPAFASTIAGGNAIRGEASAATLLAVLRAREPRIEAVELFSRSKSIGFAGDRISRLQVAPPVPAQGSTGHLLSSVAAGESSKLRFAAPWPEAGAGGIAVITLRLPAGLERAAAQLGQASRQAELLAPFSKQWSSLLALFYALLVLPLLLIAALLGLAAADLVTEPLMSLEEATRRVAAGDFAVRLIVKHGDETGRLVASFNRMLGEIERYRSDELRKEKIDAWKDIAQRLAHELKNPLTPIRLAAERILRRLRDNPARAAEIIEPSMIAIVKEVEGMDALLSDFRSFASLPEPSRDWISLRDLVGEAVAVYSASYPQVRFDLEGLPADLTLRLDRAAMKRAFGNLITNAIDSMDGKGEIDIKADLVKAADSRYCRLRIKDTGRGISPALGDQIFVPYFTTKPAGTGLGLSIVERIVADHGGSIRFESEEGAGTTFFVDLPLDR